MKALLGSQVLLRRIISSYTFILVRKSLYLSNKISPLKKVVSMVVLLAVLLNVFSKGVIFMQYQLNKAYIAQNLCENKAKKAMHCDGKCHLKKQLDKDTNEQQAPSRNTLKEKMDVQFFEEQSVFRLNEVAEGSPLTTVYTFSIASVGLPSLFHPPA